jgi:predicted DNA-binding transcriptional regulator AlpA
MRLMQFVVALAGVPSEDEIGRLLERNDDATVEVDPASGSAWVAFDREAPTFTDAVVAGVRDLDGAGMVAEEVYEDDDLVTLPLVGQRTGHAEETVWRWASGGADPGGFPAPIVEHPRRPCYLWSEVAAWLGIHFGLEQPDVTATLRAVDLALELRALGPAVERMAAVRSLLT